jgi:hydrogenase maturation protein HypF
MRLRIEGTVQGVGFRPYVFRLAHELGLAGYVLNDCSGVLLEIEGPGADVAEFVARLPREAPPLAVIERVSGEDRPASGEAAFRIAPSPAGGAANAPVTPDTATCDDCLRELLDPADRRFRYPFINCTNCGPRFTIVTGVPYDRPLTTMAGFQMCARCRAEYSDPRDRRFHAQPNACPECGPRLSLLPGPHPRGTLGAASGDGRHGVDPLDAAAEALRAGAILALKGIGGYHLACRAGDEPTVARLRARKHREDKPFALMVADLAAAERLAVLGAIERELLCAAERPIVLAPRRAEAEVAASVAPGAPELGVMLPYTPLHHLLLRQAAGPLVMTSGNVSDEPIAYRDEDAFARLAGIADLFLTHDRPIQTRTDDSVVRVAEVGGRPRTTFIRRSRGYVPAGLELPGAGTPCPLLACGAELKSTFCVAKGARAWVSHHIGDLENYETLTSFTDGIEHFERLFDVQPEVVVHDLHPEYLSTKYALARNAGRHIAVQHHHAHLAACLAEHGERGRAIGAIYDGTGYGTDGTIWGGELLYGDAREFARIGHLLPVRLPGGAQAVREPWRMACAWSVASGIAPSPALAADPARRRMVTQLARSGLASPWTTSMGRLFDAVAALCGVRTSVNYEGQAAIELEARCDPCARGGYPMSVERRDGLIVIDPRETIHAITADCRRGAGAPVVATRFHRAVARATIRACTLAAGERGTELVVLSGGVFANRRLLEATAAGLAAAGLTVLTPRRLPMNDGGIAYGQAAVAAALLEARC